MRAIETPLKVIWTATYATRPKNPLLSCWDLLIRSIFKLCTIFEFESGGLALLGRNREQLIKFSVDQTAEYTPSATAKWSPELSIIMVIMIVVIRFVERGGHYYITPRTNALTCPLEREPANERAHPTDVKLKKIGWKTKQSALCCGQRQEKNGAPSPPLLHLNHLKLYGQYGPVANPTARTPLFRTLNYGTVELRLSHSYCLCWMTFFF